MSEPTKSQPVDNIQKLAEWLKILADPTRLRIFNLLMQGVQCNCELGDQLQLPRNLISHHLNVLRQAGLIDMERDPLDARWIYFSVNPPALAELNRAFSAFFNPDRIQPRRAYCGPQAVLSNLAEVNAVNPIDIALSLNS
jgi:ArsR family transcriptional regulator